MKKWTDIIEKLTMLTQLSLSLVTPLLLCLGLCWWSSNRWSLGGWIYLIGFLLLADQRTEGTEYFKKTGGSRMDRGDCG